MPLVGRKHLEDVVKKPVKSYWNLNEHPSKDMKELRSNDGDHWYYVNTKRLIQNNFGLVFLYTENQYFHC